MQFTIKETGEIVEVGEPIENVPEGSGYATDQMELIVDDLVKYNEIEWDHDEQTDEWTYYLTLEQYQFWTEYWRHSREDDEAIRKLAQWYDRDEMRKIVIEEWGDEPYYTQHHEVNQRVIRRIQTELKPIGPVRDDT